MRVIYDTLTLQNMDQKTDQLFDKTLQRGTFCLQITNRHPIYQVDVLYSSHVL